MSDPARSRGLWVALADRIADEPLDEGNESLWDNLGERVDPAEFRPNLAPDVELKEFKLRWGNDYAMLANPRDLVHYRLEPGEAELLPLMDGTRTVKDIVVERFQESGDLELSGVADLVRQLNVGNFLDRPYENVEEMVKDALDPATPAQRKTREFVRTLSIEWFGADRLVQWAYRNVLKWFFNPWVTGAGVLFAVVGFAAFLSAHASGRFQLTGESAVAASLILLGLDYILTFTHELAHAVVLAHYDRHVKSAGFMIYFGSPTFFVESSDGLMMDRGQRIVQSLAGPLSEMMIAGVASSYVWLFPHSAISGVLFKFALLNYLIIFLNLVPLLELDGYWILADLIQVPDLRPRTMAFLRDDLLRKIRKREHFTKQEVGLTLYGTFGVAFSIFAFYTSFFFWKQIFGGLVTHLWNGGPATRILLIAVALFITGPILRAGINVVRSLSRRLRAIWRQIRFRLETRWRVEAAGLIDALPMFSELPDEALSDLAGRVRLRSFAAGKPVVRQGERADAFYVIRRGTLQVVEESPDGDERVLRVLGRGESFGELGLAQAAPRGATVKALEPSEIFEIDKGTFDRLLADMIHVPTFAPTFQEAAELRELPSFSHLEPDELSELLDHGGWVTIPPGEVILEQGAPGDAFYAIRSGKAEVDKDGELVAMLGPGDYFGEVALLMDVPRTASVIARTPIRAYRLDREGFDRLVRRAFGKGTLKPAGVDRAWQH